MISGNTIRQIMSGVEQKVGFEIDRDGWRYEVDGAKRTFTLIGHAAQVSVSWLEGDAAKYRGAFADVIIQDLANEITSVGAETTS